MSVGTETGHTTQSYWHQHAIPEIVIGGVGAALSAILVWDVVDKPLIIGWLAIAQILYVTRYLIALRALSKEPENLDVDTPQSVVIPASLQVGLALSGALWGGAGAGCLVLSGLTWATGGVFVVLVALSILVMGCYFGKPSLVIPFVLIAIGANAGAGFVVGGETALILGLASLVLISIFHLSAKYIDQIIMSLQAKEFEREKFQNLAATSNLEVERLKVGLKADREKRSELQRELGETSSSLALTLDKADALADALERVSPYDRETGLLTAKKYNGVLQREWSRMQRQQLPITVVHMQLDDFDEFKNDYGKIANEAAIRRIAELTRRAGSRPGDVVARLELNKYALLFPEADHKNGENLANMLGEQIRRLNMPNKSSRSHGAVTASFGVATAIPDQSFTLEEFAERADSALYEAQFQGGDKVVRFRTLNSIKLERWDRAMDGELTPEGLLRKLTILGYDAKPKVYRPGEYEADKRIQSDSIDAIVQGKLKFSLDGETQILSPGDCIFIPKGLVASVEVLGENPVICLHGTAA